jgi:hypothetical protein
VLPDQHALDVTPVEITASKSLVKARRS